MIIGAHNFAIISSSEESVAFYAKLGFEELLRRVRKYDTVVLLNPDHCSHKAPALADTVKVTVVTCIGT